MYPTTLFTSVLSDAFLQRIDERVTDLASCDNFWIPKSVLEDEASPPSSPVEAAVAALLPLLRDSLPADWADLDTAGCEYWVQEYEAGRGLTFHFDKDEAAMEKDCIMKNPLVSSVLYLTGSADGPLQSPTMITDQAFNHSLGFAVPDDPTRCTFVLPLRGNYCVFDGTLGHGVLDCSNGDRRATLLVNWWRERPERVHRAPVESRDDDVLVAVEALLASQREHTKLNPCFAKETPSNEICVGVSDVSEDDGCIMIDDLLKQRGVQLQGGSMFTLAHEGLSMYPIDAEQLLAADEKLSIGALLLVEDGDEESDYEEEQESDEAA